MQNPHRLHNDAYAHVYAHSNEDKKPCYIAAVMKFHTPLPYLP
jgi:hypothetical protein